MGHISPTQTTRFSHRELSEFPVLYQPTCIPLSSYLDLFVLSVYIPLSPFLTFLCYSGFKIILFSQMIWIARMLK